MPVLAVRSPTPPQLEPASSLVPLGAGEAWPGYRQFCQLFLFPLMLQAYRGVPFQPWLRGRLDGITARECFALLGWRGLLRRGVLGHVALQSLLERRGGTSA